MKRGGWYKESHRHYLAAKGISTSKSLYSKKYYSPYNIELERITKENAEKAQALIAKREQELNLPSGYIAEYLKKGVQTKYPSEVTSKAPSVSEERYLDPISALKLASELKAKNPELGFMSQEELGRRILSGEIKFPKATGKVDEQTRALSAAILAKRAYELGVYKANVPDIESYERQVTVKDTGGPSKKVIIPGDWDAVLAKSELTDAQKRMVKRAVARSKRPDLNNTDEIDAIINDPDIPQKKKFNKVIHRLKKTTGWKTNPTYVQTSKYFPKPVKEYRNMVDEEEVEE